MGCIAVGMDDSGYQIDPFETQRHNWIDPLVTNSPMAQRVFNLSTRQPRWIDPPVTNRLVTNHLTQLRPTTWPSPMAPMAVGPPTRTPPLVPLLRGPPMLPRPNLTV